MNQRSLATLIAVNVILLSSLVLVFFSTPEPAYAQGFGAGGKYLMIAGRSPQRNSQDVVYIIDVNGAKMITVIANSSLRSNNIVEVIKGRDIKPDIERATKARSGR